MIWSNSPARNKTNRKSLFEWLYGICGCKIWPATHNDPRIKGPAPRILTKEQVKAIEKFQQNAGDDGNASCEMSYRLRDVDCQKP